MTGQCSQLTFNIFAHSVFGYAIMMIGAVYLCGIVLKKLL